MMADNLTTDLMMNETDLTPVEPTPYRGWFYYKVYKKEWSYTIGMLVLLIVGTIGNTLSIIVMRRKKFKDSVTSFFFIVLALTDSFYLWLSPLRKILDSPVYLGWEIKDANVFFCFSNYYLTVVARGMSNWMLVLISLERCLAVCVPHLVKQWMSKTRGKIATLAIFIILAGVHVPLITHLYIYELEEDGSRNCENTHNEFDNKYWDTMDLMIGTAVPFGLLAIFNTVIIVRLIAAARERKKSMNASNTGPKLGTMTSLLLMTAIVFLILRGQRMVFKLIRGGLYPDERTLYYYKIRVTDQTTIVIGDLNYGINFFLYCLGGKKFRDELWAVLTCRDSRKTKGSSASITGTTSISTQ